MLPYGGPVPMIMTDLLENFTSVGKPWRPRAIWFLNSRPDESELSRQVEEFADKGLGGVVLSPIPGQPPEFSATEWRHAVDHCCREANRLGLELWLHLVPDCGTVPLSEGSQADRRMYARPLSVIIETNLSEGDCFEWSPDQDETPVLIVSLRHGDRSAAEIWRVGRPLPLPVRWICPEGEWSVAVFSWRLAKDLDTLNAEAVRLFVKSFLEPHDPSAIKGVIVGRRPVRNSSQLPWTDTLPDRFIELYGYPVYEALPHLLPNHGINSVAHRCLYWQTVSTLHRESLISVLETFCRERGWELLFADGSDEAEPLSYWHFAGPEGELERDGQFVLWKKASSDAWLRGRGRVAGEIGGATGNGWGLSPADILATVQRAAAAGITFFVPRAAVYSLEGSRKHEITSIQSYQSTFWPWYSLISDCMARLAWLFSQGRRTCSVLVMHPTTSLRAWYSISAGPATQSGNDSVCLFAGTASFLWRHGISFETIREEALPRATVHEGGIVFPGEGVEPADRFSYLVLPGAEVISAETEQFARRCLECGVRVVCVGVPPRYVLANRALTESSLGETTGPAIDVEALGEHLREAHRCALVDDVESDIAVVSERVDWGEIFLLANLSQTVTYDGYSIRLPCSGSVARLDLVNGTVSTVPDVSTTESGLELSLDFVPGQGYAFLITPAPLGEEEDGREQRPAPMVTRVEFDERYLFIPLSGNLLPLRRWELDTHPSSDPAMAACEYRTKFEIADFLGPVRLLCDGLGSMRGVEITVNGERVDEFEPGKRLDRLILEADITKMVRPGRNEVLVVSGSAAGPPTALQQMLWIEGDFAVHPVAEREVIFAPDHCMRISSWTSQGYPYYSGSVVYRQWATIPETMRYRRFFVRFESVKDLVEIRVNGRTMGTLLSPPWECEVTEVVVLGENKFEFVVANSLYNAIEASPRPSGLLGPVALEAR